MAAATKIVTELKIDTPSGMVQFVRPQSHSVREDVISLFEADSNVASHRRAGAILAACWRGTTRPRIKTARDLWATGGHVYDQLIDRGWTRAEVFSVADEVAELLEPAPLPEQAEVDHAAGFTESEGPAESPG